MQNLYFTLGYQDIQKFQAEFLYLDFYFNFFSASFCFTFLTDGNATDTSIKYVQLAIKWGVLVSSSILNSPH
jgi:hypothetical protein